MTPAQLISCHPFLYHMAEDGSWSSIRQHGLLSASQVVERSEATGASSHLRRLHRPAKLLVKVPGLGGVVLRDQAPMHPTRLRKALADSVSVEDWFELINDRVFFWAEESRLIRLLKARPYRHLTHDVLTLDTASLVKAHEERIRLCHMNSGNTFPFPTPRGPHIFQRISDYRTNTRGHPAKTIVEVTVLGGVPDIARHVRSVRRMKGDDVLGVLGP